MTFGVLVWLAAIGFTVASLAAVGVRVLRDLSLHELEEFCRKRKRRDLFDEILDHHDEVAQGVRGLQVVATTVFLLAAGACLAGEAVGNTPLTASDLAAAVIVATLLLLLCTAWIPHSVAQLWSTPVVCATWPVWRTANVAMLPLSVGAKAVDAVLRRLAGRTVRPSDEEAEEAFEDEVLTMVTEGLRDGHLEAETREMIEGVIELSDADVSDVMTPRSKMDVLQADLDWDEIMRFVVQAARTRIPVYGKNLNDILGILYVKDLLAELTIQGKPPARTLRDLLRPATFVPKTQRVDELLQSFLKTRNHMAIVVDEYMAPAGLVTMEDALEEIVGEIVDESDKETPEEIHLLGDNTAEIHGSAHLEEINERLGIDLPVPDDLDTMGGFVVTQVGDIPKSGQTIVWNNLRITVLGASRRRVERVRLEILDS